MATRKHRPDDERKRDRNGNVVREFLVRVPESLYEQIHERAYREHSSKAEIVRRALANYVSR